MNFIYKQLTKLSGEKAAGAAVDADLAVVGADFAADVEPEVGADLAAGVGLESDAGPEDAHSDWDAGRDEVERPEQARCGNDCHRDNWCKPWDDSS